MKNPNNNQPTPEAMLDLARACMPHVDDWHIDSLNRVVGWEPVDTVTPLHNEKVKLKLISHREKMGVLFNPPGNPAHAWAVETWLFDENGKPYHCYANKMSSSDGCFYCIGWDGDEQDFDTNVSAALAVLARMKGEGK